MSPDGNTIIQGWREKKLPRLWRFDLRPDEKEDKKYTTTSHKGPEAHSVYDLPSVEALVRYMHATAGFLVKPTWTKEIKHGNYNSWPGLTYNNAAKYCPQSVETIKGHMVQSPQGLRSTKNTKHQKHNNKKKTSQETIQQQTYTADILPQKNPKKSTYGINQTENCTLMIAEYPHKITKWK